MADTTLTDLSLLPERFTPLLTGKLFQPEHYHFLETTPSTNTLAMEAARDGASEGTLFVADRQTQGRGRMQRRWEAPAGSNLTFSLILRPKLQPQQVPVITLMTGVAVLEALHDHKLKDIRLKWPNDLLIHGKKICGILSEMSLQGSHVSAVIIGVGININALPEAFPKPLSEQLTSLRHQRGVEVARGDILAAVLKRFELWYGSLLQEGVSPIREAWLKHGPAVGSRVKLSSRHGDREACFNDLDQDGFLVVECTDGSRERILAGDVTPLE
ncbi:MAG: biotin--[acetyl-CoA-carboxylase] ligase [Magnetococcales bacterium]|nr:biotin--[acetyl-CoA-carboxylase] ligase [Magnetococcales bacterium]